MDMCYDGALVMPSSYAVMDEEEMTYVEGGWSGNVFMKNIKGAYNNYTAARNALIAGGLTVKKIAKTASMSAKAIFACYGSAISGAAYVIGGIVLGTIIAASLFAGITYLGNNRVWY